jgi:hypothetical protein
VWAARAPLKFGRQIYVHGLDDDSPRVATAGWTLPFAGRLYQVAAVHSYDNHDGPAEFSFESDSDSDQSDSENESRRAEVVGSNAPGWDTNRVSLGESPQSGQSSAQVRLRTLVASAKLCIASLTWTTR